jgi:hypothetical protein
MYNIKCVNMIYIPRAQPAVRRGPLGVIGVELTEIKSGRQCEMNSEPAHGFSSLISTFPLCGVLHVTSLVPLVTLSGNSCVLE